MKNIIILSSLLVLSLSVTGQNQKYIETMTACIEQLYQANIAEQYDPVINKIERIALAETDQWEPYYYMALAQTFQATKRQDATAKDKGLSQALISIEKANEKAENESEIIALRGFINMIKIGIDPATRGQTLGPAATMDFTKAISIDDTNPRAQLFMGQMAMGTAQFFGSSLEKPCEMITQSIILFDQYSGKTALSPQWGKRSAMSYQQKCALALTPSTEE